MSTIGPRAPQADGDLPATMAVANAAPELGRWTPALGCSRGALVTGATRRIGRAVALELGRLGWIVAVHHRRSDAEAASVCEDIRLAGGRAETAKGDLAEASAEGLFASAVGAVGPIGLLVNNASLYEDDDAAGMTGEGWLRHQTVNALAPLLLIQAFAAALPQGSAGSVVNIVDSRVLGSRSRHFSYAMSKSSLWTGTRLLARELAPRVRVNAIGPGPTLPEAEQSEQQFRERCDRLPLQRPASLEDITNALRFLVGTRSITGQLLALDGGDHLIA